MEKKETKVDTKNKKDKLRSEYGQTNKYRGEQRKSISDRFKDKQTNINIA